MHEAPCMASMHVTFRLPFLGSIFYVPDYQARETQNQSGASRGLRGQIGCRRHACRLRRSCACRSA
jgi:hypothetical protein